MGRGGEGERGEGDGGFNGVLGGEGRGATMSASYFQVWRVSWWMRIEATDSGVLDAIGAGEEGGGGRGRREERWGRMGDMGKVLH